MAGSTRYGNHVATKTVAEQGSAVSQTRFGYHKDGYCLFCDKALGQPMTPSTMHHLVSSALWAHTTAWHGCNMMEG